MWRCWHNTALILIYKKSCDHKVLLHTRTYNSSIPQIAARCGQCLTDGDSQDINTVWETSCDKLIMCPPAKYHYTRNMLRENLIGDCNLLISPGHLSVEVGEHTKGKRPRDTPRTSCRDFIRYLGVIQEELEKVTPYFAALMTLTGQNTSQSCWFPCQYDLSAGKEDTQTWEHSLANSDVY